MLTVLPVNEHVLPGNIVITLSNTESFKGKGKEQFSTDKGRLIPHLIRAPSPKPLAARSPEWTSTLGEHLRGQLEALGNVILRIVSILE